MGDPALRRLTLVRWPWPAVFIVLLAAVHAVIFVYDIHHPEAFVTGDRAVDRMSAIRALLEAAHSRLTLWPFLSAHGIPGDYAYQGLLFAAGGRFAVILFQVLLHLSAVVCLHGITTLVAGRGWYPGLAAASYALLPNSIAYHQLVSEALFVPLVAFSLCGSAVYLVRGRVWALALSGLIIGIAITIRPQFLLWPFVVAGFLCLGWRSRGGLGLGAVYLALALLPTGAWMTFIQRQTGSFSAGVSAHDLGSNLYGRVLNTALMMQQADRTAVQHRYLDVEAGERRALSVSRYVRFVREYPMAYLKYSGYDLLIFVAKPEVGRVLVEYDPTLLHVPPESVGNLARIREVGLVAVTREVMNENAGFVILWVGGAAVLLLYWALACMGFWSCFRSPQVAGSAGIARSCWMLAALIPYCALTGQVGAKCSARYRAPAEFAISVFFALGLVVLLRRFREARRESTID